MSPASSSPLPCSRTKKITKATTKNKTNTTTHTSSPVHQLPVVHPPLLPLPLLPPQLQSTALPPHPLVADPALFFNSRPPTELTPLTVHLTLPTLDTFLPTLLDSVTKTASHSFSVGFARGTSSGLWRQLRQDIVVSVQRAVLDPTPLNIFQATVDLLFGPARLLDNSKTSVYKPVDTPPTRLQQVLKKLKNGHVSKAFSILTGNGVAEHTTDQLDRTERLFPAALNPPSFVQTPDVLNHFDSSSISSQFTKFLLSEDPGTGDVFGWNPVLFSDPQASVEFIPAVTAFLTAFVRWNHAPVICSQLFGTGSLISLFKNSQVERDHCPSSCPPPVRPICSPSLFGKMMDRSVLQTPEAKEVVASLQPIQLGLTSSRGVQSLAAVSLGALLQGHCVGKGDFSAAFQEIDREAILSALSTKQPALANYFSRMLVSPTPMITFDDQRQVRVIWSSNGVPQGSVPGSFLFGVGVQPVFDCLQLEFPDFFFRAATDDLVTIVPPPSSGLFDDWQFLFARYARFLTRFEVLSSTLCNLRQNTAKGALVLPYGAPLPSEETLLLFPADFKFLSADATSPPSTVFTDRQDGFVVGGAPVGSLPFVDAFVQFKTDQAIYKLQPLRELGVTNAHDAFKVLTTCGIKLLSYVAQVVPPSFTVQHLARFDKEVLDIFFGFLTPPDSPSPLSFMTCERDRIKRATLRALLSVGSHGVGLLSAEVSAPAQWWSCMDAVAFDPTLTPFLQGLNQFTATALKIIISLSGGPTSSTWFDICSLFTIRLFAPRESYTGLQKNFLRKCLSAVGKSQLALVEAEFDPRLVSPSSHLTESDVVAFHSRSDLSTFFSPSKNRSKSMSTVAFVHFTRLFLGLPPVLVLGNAVINQELGYVVETCMSQHGKTAPELDATGDHQSSSCPSSHLAKCRTHTSVMSHIIRFAEEAGALTKREPTTDKLLPDLPKNQCARLFPRKPPLLYTQVSTEIIKCLTAPPGSVDNAKIAKLFDTLPVLDVKNSGALRIDASIQNPTNNDDDWIDATRVHTTCASYIKAEFRAVSLRLSTSQFATKAESVDPLLWSRSPALHTRAQRKITKYSRLMLLAERMAADRRLPSKPNFVPFVVSSLGELSREAFQFREKLVSLYRKRVFASPCLVFPKPPSVAVSNYRARFTHGLMRVLADGLASVMMTAGRPPKLLY